MSKSYYRVYDCCKAIKEIKRGLFDLVALITLIVIT